MTGRHGATVVSGSFFGQVTCRLGPGAQMVVVQPCNIDREPQGPAVRLGPVRSPTDVSAIRAYLEGGGFDADDIPPYLLALHRDTQAAARN